MLEFKVETGEALEDSTSYVSVEFADQYIQAFYPDHFPDWDEKSVSQKEFALIVSTTFLDNLIRWESQIVNQQQALSWPRRDFKDKQGRIVKHDSVPKIIKESTVRIAKEKLTGNADIDEQPVYLMSQDYGDSRESYVGPTREGGNDEIHKTRITLMRNGYGSANGSIVDVVRA